MQKMHSRIYVEPFFQILKFNLYLDHFVKAQQAALELYVLKSNRKLPQLPCNARRKISCRWALDRLLGRADMRAVKYLMFWIL